MIQPQGIENNAYLKYRTKHGLLCARQIHQKYIVARAASSCKEAGGHGVLQGVLKTPATSHIIFWYLKCVPS